MFYVLNKRDNKLEFNLFDVITHKWNKEKLHSELLKFFLNNYEDFFYNFLDLIGIENKDNYSNAEIPEYEKNYIDISIIGNKKIIIIENKINWAKDQQEQLANYYKKVCGEYEVEKIVYIAPSKYKEPEEHTFGFDNEIKNQVKDKYIKIISFDATDKDLVTCFEKSRYNFKDDKLFFMNHYIEILKRTGEGDMSETELNFFNEIFFTKKNNKGTIAKIYVKNASICKSARTKPDLNIKNIEGRITKNTFEYLAPFLHSSIHKLIYKPIITQADKRYN